jgi:PKD domain.
MIMPAKKWLTSFIIVSTIVLVCSCSLFNLPPTITSIKAEAEMVLSSDSCQAQCLAADREGDELSYEWSATAGTVSGNCSTVVWNAPDEPGEYTISVDVTDEMGNKPQGPDFLHFRKLATFCQGTTLRF